MTRDSLADKSQTLLLDGLRRAMAEPGGLPVIAAKSQPGLFAGTAAGKQAAQLCEQEGYLRKLGTETRGKTTIDICAISEKGLAFLLGQVNPRPILEVFVQSLESRQGQFAELLGSAQASQRYLEELKETVHKALEHFRQARPESTDRLQTGPHGGGNGNGVHKAEKKTPNRAAILLDQLRLWHGSGALGDCPLPRLFTGIRSEDGPWTVGQFHDLLRSLHEERKIYLHPWTGPLYEMPEPSVALLIGHEVAYYASLRQVGTGL